MVNAYLSTTIYGGCRLQFGVTHQAELSFRAENQGHFKLSRV